MICAEHGIPLVVESGGTNMPTLHGRRYCPVCQAEFMAVLGRGDEVREGAIEELIESLERRMKEAGWLSPSQ